MFPDPDLSSRVAGSPECTEPARKLLLSFRVLLESLDHPVEDLVLVMR